jgi:hypothetical protein
LLDPLGQGVALVRVQVAKLVFDVIAQLFAVVEEFFTLDA